MPSKSTGSQSSLEYFTSLFKRGEGKTIVYEAPKNTIDGVVEYKSTVVPAPVPGIKFMGDLDNITFEDEKEKLTAREILSLKKHVRYLSYLVCVLCILMILVLIL